MRSSSILFALAAPILSLAAPARYLGKRAAADILVFREFPTFSCLMCTLQHPYPSSEFADVLEQLESTFYQQALSKFKSSDFTAAGFISSQIPMEQFTTIQADEATHSSVLQVLFFFFLFFTPFSIQLTQCSFSLL